MKNILLSFFVFISVFASAQNYEFGALIGNSSYIGDLVCLENHRHFGNLNPALGIFGKYNYGKWSTRLGLTSTSVEANDLNSHYPERGLNFKSSILELGLILEYNIYYLNLKNAYIAPYIMAGGSVFSFNPKGEYNGEWMELQPYGTEGQGLEGHADHYNRTSVAIPFGAGIKFAMKNRITIGAEIMIRKLFTDYLDDVSGTALNYSELYEGNGEIAAYLSAPTKNINPNNMDFNYSRGASGKDMFYSCQISISYTLGKDSQACPSFYGKKNTPEF